MTKTIEDLISELKLSKTSIRTLEWPATSDKLRLALANDEVSVDQSQSHADHPRVEAFCSFIKASDFPCVGAKAALARHQIEIVIARDITSTWDDLRIYPLLRGFAERYRTNQKLFQSFVVLFENPHDLTEAEFEQALWSRVQSLSHKDEWVGFTPDERVSDNPNDPHFSLSFAGEAFFVVGLHPNASRPARRFQVPALVFNLHQQFELLREAGNYEKMRETILTRDEQLAGSLNPMLSRFGETSEAKQYSGRVVSNDWKCPFKGREIVPHGR